VVSGRMFSIMENVGKKRARPRRSFTAQFKGEIVEDVDILKRATAFFAKQTR
jgi:hypothetical protein